MSQVEWINVEGSTRVVRIGYSEDEQQIHAEMPDGHHHVYEDCTREIWEEFSAVDTSKGKYLRSTLDFHTHHPA